MQIINDTKTLRLLLNSSFKRYKWDDIGFVPTMGALHEGHFSLVKKAKANNTVVIVSIYVNPTQFGPNEDLDSYPRTLDQDAKALEQLGVDILFAPTTLYESDFSTFVEPRALTSQLCGAKREGHFEGVTTVVTKLFNLCCPSHAYFGQKDFQQLQIIKRMTRDLNIETQIIGCPILREKDGLAMSSRNRYLSTEHRVLAPLLNEALLALKHKIKQDSKQSLSHITHHIKEHIKLLEQKGFKVDYLECVNASTLNPVTKLEEDKNYRLCIAAFIGQTRLIDNIAL